MCALKASYNTWHCMARHPRLSDLALSAILSICAFALCLVVSASHFHMIDEGSMFVTAVNIVDRGEFHTNQLGWAQWSDRPGNQIGFATDAGDVFSKKSPLVIALMTPLVAAGRLIPGLSLIQATLLLGPIFTALTAALIYGFARDLDYSRLAGTAAALVFLLGTMALMYSKTVLGEPISSFGLMLALRYAAAHRAQRPNYYDVLCGAGLALAIGTSSAYILLLPVFALALTARQWRVVPVSEHVLRLIRFSSPVVGMAAALAGYNYLRFGNFLESGYHFAPGQEGFTTPIWWGLFGLTVSPARGFFWFNPPALLSLVAWPRFHRSHRTNSWLMLAVLAMHALVFTQWWEWWGGAWGPRYFLPIVPYVIVACLPLWQSTLVNANASWLARTGVSAVLVAGVAVQIAAVSIDYNIYESELEAQFPAPRNQPRQFLHDTALVYHIARSPILVHFQRLFTSQLDFAWRPEAWKPLAAPAMLSTIRLQQRPGDAIVYLAPELIDVMLDRDLPPVYGLPVNVPATDELAQRLFARARRDADRIWLITWYGAGDPANWYEVYLREDWASVSEEQLDGYRVVLFARPPDTTTSPLTYTFGPLRLTNSAVQLEAGTLFIELHWRANTPPPDNYVSFVHVIGADGVQIAGQDRQPLGGYRPTGAWRSGDAITDRFAFVIPADQLDGAQIEVGWYSWPSLERLPLTDSAGQRIPGDGLMLPIP